MKHWRIKNPPRRNPFNSLYAPWTNSIHYVTVCHLAEKTLSLAICQTNFFRYSPLIIFFWPITTMTYKRQYALNEVRIIYPDTHLQATDCTHTVCSLLMWTESRQTSPCLFFIDNLPYQGHLSLAVQISLNGPHLTFNYITLNIFLLKTSFKGYRR